MAKQPTIAVIGTRGFPGIQGGVEIHCQNIYTRMAENSNVHIRVYRRKPYLTSQSHQSYPGISFVDLPSTRIKGFETMWHTLLCVLHIALHRPSVVHVHNIGPGMLSPLLRIMGLPVVMTYHSPNYEHSKWGPISRTILRFAEWVSFRSCNRIIFVSKFQREKFSQKVLDNSTYIPNGISDVSRSTATDFLAKHGIEAGNYVLSVGRITPEKGFDYLVNAVQQLPQVEQLVIAGASDHGDDYLNRLKTLDTHHKVIFTGFTSGENLRQLYSHARLYVLSSVNEGFPLVLLEAMNYGLPLAVSDIPACHLVQLPESDYFAKADTTDMAKVISAKLNEQPTEQHYDLSHFSWQSVISATARELTSVIHQ